MIHILGIRHHGPGSAKNVRNFLEEQKPDIVLVEGPPEADEILKWVNHKELKPPVAILCFRPDNPHQSSFYPFAEFSPEWQAILYARKNNIPVKFMDLPAAHQFAIEEERQKQAELEAQKAAEANETDTNSEDIGITDNSLNNAQWFHSGIQYKSATQRPLNKYYQSWLHNNNQTSEETIEESEAADEFELIRRDPISHLAKAAGYEDGEKWWEQMFEHRHNDEQVFDAVLEAMTSLREAFPKDSDVLEKYREAYMRKTIRQAEKEMYGNIAVVCGAWHAPALANMPKVKDDNDLLKGLPKVKVECTWVPWTYSRLSFSSGYGAGIFSPGWYEHIWKFPIDDGTRWMAKVARLFRENNMDTSVAHVVEGVRLANTLSALRALPKAGLEELNEAVLSVLCNGESILLNLVHDQLIVSNKLGKVPSEIPKPPLQVDLEKLQKKLKFPSTADWKDYTLDLRKENDLERSILLHRLLLLGIDWGQKTFANSKGTFKEAWRLQWKPALSIELIDKGNWGNTVEEAATNYTKHKTREATKLGEVCHLLENTLPSNLPKAIDELILTINNLSAATGDVIELMEVIPSLVTVSRYGNVRKTDVALVTDILNSMITRICVSLPAACTSVNEDAAAHLLDLFYHMNDAVSTLQIPEIVTEWQDTLKRISGNSQIAPVLAGYATRLLSNYKVLEGDALLRAFYFAMSTATAPATAASWLEGFLKGSGTLLLLDDTLWSVVYNWVTQLDEENFMHVLPLLRRTFANFNTTERKKIGEKVKNGNVVSVKKEETSFDTERAAKSIPVVMKLLGY